MRGLIDCARYLIWDMCWALRALYGYEYGSFAWRHPLAVAALGVAATAAVLAVTWHVLCAYPADDLIY